MSFDDDLCRELISEVLRDGEEVEWFVAGHFGVSDNEWGQNRRGMLFPAEAFVPGVAGSILEAALWHGIPLHADHKEEKSAAQGQFLFVFTPYRLIIMQLVVDIDHDIKSVMTAIRNNDAEWVVKNSISLPFTAIRDKKKRPIRDIVIESSLTFSARPSDPQIAFKLSNGVPFKLVFPLKMGKLAHQYRNAERIEVFFRKLQKHQLKGESVLNPDESLISDWSDPNSKNGCEAFGEFDPKDESCAACRKSTPETAEWCKRFSKKPSKAKREAWQDPDGGCNAFGEEYDPDDEVCTECNDDDILMWYWCRKQSLIQSSKRRTE